MRGLQAFGMGDVLATEPTAAQAGAFGPDRLVVSHLQSNFALCFVESREYHLDALRPRLRVGYYC
jgi:hypothetical protein